MNGKIRIALPKGRLFNETAALLQEAGWELRNYTKDTRNYHINSEKYPFLSARIFHEKDIPIQVATGNYDLGICGFDWVKELSVKYPSSDIIKIKDLGYGSGNLLAFTGKDYRLNKQERIRIVSEYPNIAEGFAAGLRLHQFNIYPVWGAAEAYPPEDADIAIISDDNQENILKAGLVPLEHVLSYNACLIANRKKWETRDMSVILSSLRCHSADNREKSYLLRQTGNTPVSPNQINGRALRIAIPDGHQQPHTINLLTRAGIIFDSYTGTGENRRPISNLENVFFKVIRPQDMPFQVANGNFDLAFTGKDWLKNHLYQFPTSPVIELLDLKYARVRIVAAVHESLGIQDTPALRKYIKSTGINLRIASEYVNIADRYARDNHLGYYRIIPTFGATEAFLPDDADVLIENTETGRTLARHNLKIIETLFESTGCVIGCKESLQNSEKQSHIHKFISRLNKALE